MARGGPGAGRDAGAVLFCRWWDCRLSRHAAGNLKHSHRPAATLSSSGHPPAVASVLGRAAVNWTASAGRLAPAAIDAGSCEWASISMSQPSPAHCLQRLPVGPGYNATLLHYNAATMLQLTPVAKVAVRRLGSNGSLQAVAPDARGRLGTESAACCRAGPREPQAALQARTTRTGG